MADYGRDSPFPGDYQPGVDASPGFLHTFDSSMPHFSPAGSDNSYPASVAVDSSRPGTSGSAHGGPTPAGDIPLGGGHGPGHTPSHMSGHQHTHSTQSGHSHSFSTASLPSLTSSSTSYSVPSLGEPQHQPHMFMTPAVGHTPADYSPAMFHQQEAKPMVFTSHMGHPGGHPAHMSPPVGLGMGMGMPPNTMPGTVPPALFSRSPSVGQSGLLHQGYPSAMGKIPHDRHRGVSRPSPYDAQLSRAASHKSEADEELMSIYSGASAGSYHANWSHNPGMITGDMGQMSLEHRRSNSIPYDVPPMGGSLAGRSRARSFSLGKSSASLEFLETDLEMTGPAAERETHIRADLASKADQVRSLSPCQHGKARAVWAKRWYVRSEWLKLSYTPINGFTVPRQGLYHSYTMSCNDFGLRPINSASFGKVVRSTFLGIRTRRLGVRGNSKYHYVSLRPAISTEAHRLNAYGDSSGQLHIAPQEGDFSAGEHSGQEILTEDDTDEEEEDELADLSEGGMPYTAQPQSGFPRVQYQHVPGSHSPPGQEALIIRSARPAYLRNQAATTPTLSGASSGATTAARLTSPGDSRASPPFPQLPDGADNSTIAFWQRFCATQEILGRNVGDLAFDQFEQNFRTLWDYWTPEVLQQCGQRPLAGMIVEAMGMSFDHIILVLVDQILRPLPPSAHASLSVLASKFEKLTSDSVAAIPREVAQPIIEMSKQAGFLFARFLDLHQITTAVVPILAEPEQLTAMRTSWRMLDTDFIVRQSSVACNGSDSILQPAIAEFGAWLNQVNMNPSAHPIEQLASCIDGAIARAESSLAGISNPQVLVPRASHITSQVMRLLTLRSDMSFGWFQLLKTWIDDYVGISCSRRAAFTRQTDDIQVYNAMSIDMTGAPPTLAIDTASAQYHTVSPFDQTAITPRPAFTSSGSVTAASGPGVGGIAGNLPGTVSISGAGGAGAPAFM